MKINSRYIQRINHHIQRQHIYLPGLLQTLQRFIKWHSEILQHFIDILFPVTGELQVSDSHQLLFRDPGQFRQTTEMFCQNIRIFGRHILHPDLKSVNHFSQRDTGHHVTLRVKNLFQPDQLLSPRG